MTKDRDKDRHVRQRYLIGFDDQDWTEFGEIVGNAKRHEVLRQMVQAFLKRPGVKIPRRKEYESTPETAKRPPRNGAAPKD